jgi:hypothetical protein
MTFDPRDVAGRVPACPKCGEKHYTYEMAPNLPLKVKKIRCAQSGADILRAFLDAEPNGFGFTIGQLNRLALWVGVALLAVFLLQFFLSR